MNYLNLSLENLSFISIFIATLSYWFDLTKKNEKKRTTTIGNITTIVANLGLGLLLVTRWLEYKYFPLSNLYESLLFLSDLNVSQRF